MRRFGYPKKPDDPSNPYRDIVVYLPRSLKLILEEKAKQLQMPMSRLICYAVDNELDAPHPFTYLCQWPMNEYIEDAYAEEAQKIYQHMLKFPSGLGRDALMLGRRDVGVLNRNDLMLGLRELIKKELVEETAPPKKVEFKYGPDYKYLRIKGMKRPTLLDRKRKMLEKLQKEIAMAEGKTNGSPSVEPEVRGSSVDDKPEV